jgi:hypothetical protein
VRRSGQCFSFGYKIPRRFGVALGGARTVDDHVDSSKSLGEARTAAEISDWVLGLLGWTGAYSSVPAPRSRAGEGADDLTSEVAGTAGDQNSFAIRLAVPSVGRSQPRKRDRMLRLTWPAGLVTPSALGSNVS